MQHITVSDIIGDLEIKVYEPRQKIKKMKKSIPLGKVKETKALSDKSLFLLFFQPVYKASDLLN